MLPKPRYLPAGESALVVEFGDTIDPKIHDRVLALDAALQQAKWEGVIETVPTYRSLDDPFRSAPFDDGGARRCPRRARLRICPAADAAATLAHPRLLRRRRTARTSPRSRHFLSLSPARIIGLHLGARYRVYMYGFAPGFTFLGGLPEELKIPRRAVPRAPVPPGSLLIAGGQALIAGCAMPTGWYAIGRTPVKMFDPRREPVFLAGIGDELCFERIDPAAFDAMSTAADAGEFCARHEYLDEP